MAQFQDGNSQNGQTIVLGQFKLGWIDGEINTIICRVTIMTLWLFVVFLFNPTSDFCKLMVKNALRIQNKKNWEYNGVSFFIMSERF